MWRQHKDHRRPEVTVLQCGGLKEQSTQTLTLSSSWWYKVSSSTETDWSSYRLDLMIRWVFLTAGEHQEHDVWDHTSCSWYENLTNTIKYKFIFVCLVEKILIFASKLCKKQLKASYNQRTERSCHCVQTAASVCLTVVCLSVCLSEHLSVVWGGQSCVFKRWCHKLQCTNQDLTIFKVESKDGC